MKNMLITLLVLLSVSATAFAEEPAATIGGTITQNGEETNLFLIGSGAEFIWNLAIADGYPTTIVENEDVEYETLNYKAFRCSKVIRFKTYSAGAILTLGRVWSNRLRFRGENVSCEGRLF